MGDAGTGSAPKRARRRIAALLAVAVIVVACAVFAWNAREAGVPAARQAEAEPAFDTLDEDEAIDAVLARADVPARRASTTASAAAPTPAADSPRAVDLPAEGTPPREAIAALLPLVEEGRADATHALAMELVQCQRARGLRSDEAIRNGLLRRFRWRNGRDPSSDAELDSIASDIERMAAARERCAGIDDDLFNSRLDLLEKAAAAGNTDAMLDYADWGLQDMDGYNAILRNFDEVARRRTQAAGVLNRAHALGDCRALGVLAEAYAGERGRRNWIVSADPYLASVYSEAGLLAPGADATASAAYADRRGAALDAAQRAAARAQALRLVQRHCAG